MNGFTFRHSRLVLGLWFLPAILGGYLFLSGFELNNSVGVWFPKDDPALADYEEFLETFGPWEWTLLLLDQGKEFGPSISEVRALTRRLERLPSIRQVLGPDAVASLGTGSLGSEQVSGNLRGIPLLLETANQIHRGDDFRAELLEQIRREVRLCDGVASHTVVGTSVINVGLNRSAKRDMLLFFNLVFVLLVAVSRILLRSWRDTLVILVVATSAVTFVLGLAAVLGHRFNILTIMMPTLLIALSVANLVHLVHAFHHHWRSGNNTREAAARAVREVRLPALGATLTTVLGFLSLAVSDMPPVRQLSLYSAAGILLAWLGSMVVAPVLLARAWEGRGAGPPPARSRLRALDAWARRLPRMGPALLLLMAVSIPLLIGLSRLETDTNYVNFFRPGSRVRTAYEEAARAGIPQSSIEVVVRSSSASVSKTSLDLFLDGIRSLPETKGILLPDETRDLRGFRAQEGHALRVVLFVEFIGNGAMGDLASRIRRTGAELFPEDSEILVTGSPVLWERMDSSIVRTQKSSTLIVALGAFVLLAVLFKSLRAAAAGWLSSALPVGIILGLMGWLGVPVTLATVLIAGITLGLAVDDTVHLVTAIRLRLAAGIQTSTAVREALLTVGERMIVTSLILAGSFSVMAFSDFTPTASFGVFTALTILIAAVADLTILPWMLGRNWMWKTTALPSRRLSTKPHTGVHGDSRKSGLARPAPPGVATITGLPPAD